MKFFSGPFYKWYLTLTFLLFSIVYCLAQKELKKPDQQLSPQTIKTEKWVKFKHNLRVFKPLFYDYEDPHFRYHKEKKRKVIQLYVGGGKNSIPVFEFFCKISIFLGLRNTQRSVFILTGDSHKYYVPYYGLKSATDQKELLPAEYKQIDTLKKEVYLLRKWNKKALYFRNLNRLTTLWDSVDVDLPSETISLTRRDSVCVMDFNGRTVTKTLRGH